MMRACCFGTGRERAVGLAAGRIRETARLPLYRGRQTPRSCASHRHVELIDLALPAGLAMTTTPEDVRVSQGPYSYTARYERTATGLKARRELTVAHPQRLCLPEADRAWQAVSQAIKRDLRAQVFLR